MADGKKKLDKVLTVQLILSLLVIGLLVFLISGISAGRRDIRQVENMPKVSEDRLGEIQGKIREKQEEGIAYSDPFITDRLDLDEIKYVGRIQIPKISVNESVVLGTSPDALNVGVGILEGSDLPLGEVGNSTILAGHRGYLFRSDFFRDLGKLEIGDKIQIELDHKELTYEVFSVKDVKVDDVSSVHIDGEGSYVALVTSPKFWVTEDRLLVEAKLVTE